MNLADELLRKAPKPSVRGRVISPLGHEPPEPIAKRLQKERQHTGAMEIVAEVCASLGWGFTSQDVADLAKLKGKLVSEYMIRMERRGVLSVTGEQRRNGKGGRSPKIYSFMGSQ